MTSRIVEQGRGCDAGMGNGGSMNERLEMLKKARDRMIEDRDAHAKVLAAPFDRDKSERARSKFVETQMLIEALERAMNAEERTSAAP
jgi:hypothetical protein